ncbi:DUF3180 domain-containing protein [Cellulomonas sp. McL0617]|uniref:DUF3180 domain-containing protein n=1 Tax=Cellulomonas sp. McL0617 TaxID=3415675 RepID=UPI003CE8460E
MHSTRWQTLLLTTAGVAVGTWIVLRSMARDGALPPSVPWLVVVVELAIAAVVFVLGWHVRQYLQGKRPNLSALRAARTVVLAKASCYTGALLAGWYGGHVLALLSGTDEPGTGGRVLSAAIAMAGGVVLAVVGLVVERFCRIPPPDASADAARDRPAPGASTP